MAVSNQMRTPHSRLNSALMQIAHILRNRMHLSKDYLNMENTKKKTSHMLSSLLGFFTLFAFFRLHNKYKTCFDYLYSTQDNNLEAFPFLRSLENLPTFYLNVCRQLLLKFTESSLSSFLFFRINKT